MRFNSNKYQQIYNTFEATLEFEFHSYYSTQKTKDEFKSLLGNQTSFFSNKLEYKNSNSKISLFINDDFKYPSIKLKVQKLSHKEGHFIISKIFDWIKLYGYTESYNFLKVSLSVAEGASDLIRLTNLSEIKIILEVDEPLLYSLFPNVKKNPFIGSAKFLKPINKGIKIDPSYLALENYTVSNLNSPIVFNNSISGNVQFKYIGGEYYEKMASEAINAYNYYYVLLYKCLMSPAFTAENYTVANNIIKTYNPAFSSYKSFKNFKKFYPKIKLTANLSDDEQIVNSYWSSIQDNLLDLLVHSNLSSGKINYDPDESILQLRSANIKAHSLKNIELVQCKITNSVFSNVHFYDCEIKYCKIKDSNFFNGSTAENSVFKNCYMTSSAKLKDCYVHGKFTAIEGEMDGGILKLDAAVINEKNIKDNVKKVKIK